MGPVQGLNYDLPPGVPGLRPVPTIPETPTYADPAVGGLTYVSPGGVLDGSPAPSLRSDGIVYVPASNPRPSLPDGLRTAWRAFRDR
jgi:hypothetical protein